MRRRSTGVWLPAAAILVLVGPALAFSAYRIAEISDGERVQTAFARHVAHQAAALERQVYAYVEVLHSLRGLYDASEEVTREEFGVFTQEARKRHPTLVAIEWAPHLEAAHRRAHVVRVRAEGHSAYAVREFDSDGTLRLAGERPTYYPVCFVEPTEGNELALGLDLGAEVTRADAIRRTTLTGEATLTRPIALVQDDEHVPALILMLAVPAKAGEGTVAGVVLVVFRGRDAAEASLVDQGGHACGHMYATLDDVDADGRVTSIFSTPPVPGDQEPQQRYEHDAYAAARVQHWIHLGGRRWRLRAVPTPLFLSEMGSSNPAVMAIAVLLAWELLAGLLLFLGHTWRRGALDRQARIVRSVLRNLSEGVFVTDETGQPRLVNEAAERMIGRRGRHSARGTWSETYGVFLPDGRTPYPEDHLPLARALLGETVTDQQMLVRNPERPDGIWLSVSGTPLLDEDGGLLGGVVVMRDVTAGRESEESLRRLSSAVEQTADSVLITSRAGRILYVNPAFEAMTGYDSAEVMGKSPRFLAPADVAEDFYQESWRQLLAGEVVRKAVQNRRKSGEVFWSDQTVTPMRDDNDEVTHFVAVATDATERRQLEEQEHEMRMAADVQQRLYPDAAPHLKGWDLAGTVFPAVATSGDYFDYIRLANGDLLLAVGDVCGHGLGPAMVMTETRAYLRSLADAGLEPAQMLRRTNEYLAEDLVGHMFVTLLLVRLEPRTGLVDYASAGHTPAYILSASGRVKAELRASGYPLGPYPDGTYGGVQGPILESGDLLLLLTDGAPESRNATGEFFGEERLVELVAAHRHESAQRIIEAVDAEIRAFTGRDTRDDDITLVICRRL